MPKIHRFTVTPAIPERLKALKKIASNMWWCWNAEAVELYRRLDPELWEKTHHNPILMLGEIEQQKLDAFQSDDSFLAHMDRVEVALEVYMNSETWFEQHHPESKDLRIAYFSAEFGLHESIRIYAGGLGVLAGEHFKSASDLGLPMVGVGLAYHQGYFRQYLNIDGWQQEMYPVNDFYNLPFFLVRDAEGKPVSVRVEMAGRIVNAIIWRVNVGRIPLYLLSTNIESNRPEDRAITAQLYGGDSEMRIQQEVLLGIGGLRALQALDIKPMVCHMNEGHSSFLALERIRTLMKEYSCDFHEASQAVAAGNVFTTHTPVPAGIDKFTPDLIEKYMGRYYKSLGLSQAEFLSLGRISDEDKNEKFSMAVLAIRLADKVNAVSKLHRLTSHKMWQSIWPDVPCEEVPIDSVTNGVHIRSWLSYEMAQLLDRYLGPRWIERPVEEESWKRVDQIPDAELWRTHERRRERLVGFCRTHLADQLRRRGASTREIEVADEVLDPEALTIGFARRFAGYKRGNLILRDTERLAKILENHKQPVQIVFSGKAHPRDNEGKELIKQVIHLARLEQFRHHVVFLEDYDINVARYLVQGVDVWLNTPRRPLEASGTSGMKICANGGLNLSVPDGWWDEAYDSTVGNGWTIGRGEEYEDKDYQDEVESRAIYDLLEEEIVPLFYQRGHDGLPRGWIARMKTAMKTLCPFFNTNRMVRDYLEWAYMEAGRRYMNLFTDGMKRAKDLSAWKKHVKRNWDRVEITKVETEQVESLPVHQVLRVQAWVFLGPLLPDEVRVQIYYGRLDPEDKIVNAKIAPMEVEKQDDRGGYRFVGDIKCESTGQHGFTVRVIPYNPDKADHIDSRMIRWSENS
jgi:starch phosphorylase